MTNQIRDEKSESKFKSLNTQMKKLILDYSLQKAMVLYRELAGHCAYLTQQLTLLKAELNQEIKEKQHFLDVTKHIKELTPIASAINVRSFKIGYFSRILESLTPHIEESNMDKLKLTKTWSERFVLLAQRLEDIIKRYSGE